LLERDHKLRSETDTELIPHLIEEALKRKLDLAEAVRATVAQLRGSFSIVVISETDPGRLVAAKTATPLVPGFGDRENFVASDIPAILEHTRLALVMEDGELADISSSSINLTTFAGQPIERAPRRIEWEAIAAAKGGFAHYLRKEISEQPQTSIETLSGRASLSLPEVRFESELLPPAGANSLSRIVLVGGGIKDFLANRQVHVRGAMWSARRRRLFGGVSLSQPRHRRRCDARCSVPVGRDRRYAGGNGRRTPARRLPTRAE
jgi:glutamine---fructose-6-phosphate transaminase (isomerizing)